MTNLHERFPAFGGRGPGDMRVGIALGVVATLFIALRIYVRLRINNFGTAALVWALIAWVRGFLSHGIKSIYPDLWTDMYGRHSNIWNHSYSTRPWKPCIPYHGAG